MHIRQILLTSLFTLFIPFAGAVGVVVSPTGTLPNVGTDPGSTIASVISYGITMTAVLAVMSITWGAIQMILAVGEDEKLKKGRMIIIYSFVGLLVAGLAYGIVKTITNLQF